MEIQDETCAAAVGSGGRITGMVHDMTLPKDARIIDGHGRFLIPGMWDMQVHLASVVIAAELWEPTLWLFPANGVTGVRDMGCDWDVLRVWRDKIDSGAALGAEMVAAGLILDGPAPGVSSHTGRQPAGGFWG